RPCSLLGPLVLLVLMLSCEDVTGSRVDTRPNFVLIMADDLGIGDVGCYGNKTIRAGQSRSCAGAAVPGRVGGLPPTETTFAKRLQEQGYTTGLVGKWHLGVNCASRGDRCHHPNHHGFHYYYGLPFTMFNNCVPGEGSDVLADVERALRHLSLLLGLALLTLVCLHVCGLLSTGVRLLATLACVTVLAVAVWWVPFGFLRTWNCIVMRNQEVVEQPLVTETLTERMLKEAQHFISRNAHHPFLLFFSLAHVHTPLFRSPAFAGKSHHGVYGDNVEEMDWVIGQVMESVDSLGLANNTMMYFTSDHGGHVEDPERGGWNGIYKGGKAMGGWEGGIRVPGIFRWPGRLPAGRVVDEPTSLMDLYPTLTHLAQDTQADRPLDGYNLMPLLDGSSSRSEHQFMFHYCGVYLNAHVTHHDPPIVYDLSRDPSESRPLGPATEGRFAEVLRRVGEAAAEHRRSLAPEGSGGQSHVGTPGAASVASSQLSWENVLWKPWLQPCCGTFPFCGCRENATRTA
ncbi:hypothetical protein CRUP_010461, partial [Coryphaenoides rupestris]